MSDTAEVDVSVDVPTAPSTDAGPVVVVTESDGGGDEVTPAVVDLAATVGALVERVAQLEERVIAATVEAESANAAAGAALAETDRLAVETEEAVATLAEATEETAPEVVAEIEDVAPQREHPWFRGRTVLKGAE